MTTLLNKYKADTINDIYISDKKKKNIKIFIGIDNVRFLIVGGKCSGKTTLINMILNEYYKDKKKDILYIDSNCGINYLKTEVKYFCKTTSLNGKKTIVVDDLDNYNEFTQHILRPYIDNYSDNVNFIFSCTDFNKIVINIINRIEVIKLDDPDYNTLGLLYDKIIKNENLKIPKTEEFKKYFIDIVENSIPKLFNMFEKIKLIDTPINKDKMFNIFYGVNYSFFNMYIEISTSGDILSAINYIKNNICKQPFIDFLNIFVNYIKYISNLDEELKYEIIKLISKYIVLFYNRLEDEIEYIFFTNEIVNLLTTTR